MKKLVMLSLVAIVCIAIPLHAQNRFWVASSSGFWNDANNWSTSSGGAGGASVPGASNVAIFNGASGRNGNCVLNIAPTVGGISMNGYTGSVDLNGNNLTTTGTNTFTSGSISNSGATASLVLNSTTVTTTFNGTTFHIPVTGTSGRIFFNGSTFNSTVSLTKAANSTDDNTGGNTFNGAVSLTSNVTSAAWRLGGTNPDIFNNTLAFILGNTGDFYPSYGAAGTQYNDDVSITYNGNGDVFMGFNGGTSTLASGKVISVAGFGAAGCGALTLSRLTQLGTTPQSYSLGGNDVAALTLGPSSVFQAPVTANTPVLVLNTSTFQNTASFTQYGNTSDGNSPGGNIFQSDVTFTNTGDRDIQMGSSSATPGDIYQGTSNFYDLGGGRIRIGSTTAGNIFNGPAFFYSSGANDSNNRIQISRFSGASTTFNGPVTIVNDGNSSDVHVSYEVSTSTTFNSDLTLVNATSATGDFYVGVDGTVTINGNLNISSTCPDNLYFSQASGTTTFGNGVITIGSFNTGTLRLRNFTQTGSTAQTMNMGGNATLRIGPASTFNGSINVNVPQLYLDGATYNGAAVLEKSGASANTSSANNTFASTLTLRNSGSGAVTVSGANTFNGVTNLENTGSASMTFNGGNIFNASTTILNSSTATFDLGTVSPETFQGDVTINNTGSYRVQIGVDAVGTVFNGNVTINHGGTASTAINTIIARNAAATAVINGDLTLNCTNTTSTSGIIIGNDGNVTVNGNIRMLSTSGRGILFGASNGAVTLGDGFSIQDQGAGTFTTGTLTIRNFTQLGNTAQAVTTTGSTTVVIGPAATFGGDVTLMGPRLYMNGATYNGTAYLEKTGSGDDAGTGGNTYNSTTTIVNSSSGYLMTGNTSADIFNGEVTFTNQGTNAIYVAYNVAGTQFNGDIKVNCTSGTGIFFSNATNGTATLANGGSIAAGNLGFTTGELRLNRFTQLGGTTQDLSLSGTALLRLSANTTFNGPVNFIAPQVRLDGATFSSTTYIEKNGATNNAGAGGNTFNGNTTLTCSGSGYLMTGNTAADIFNGDLTLNNTGSSFIYVAYNTPGTQFNGNITVNSPSGSGIIFGGATNGSSTLASGNTIGIGASGFSSGELRLARFTQIGSTSQNLTLTNTALLRVGPASSFDGNVNFVAPQVALDGATYNGTSYIEKTGATNNAGTGGNTFNGTTTLACSAPAYFMTGNTAPDIFNGDLTLTNTGTSFIYLAYNAAGTQFNGNIVFNATSGSGIILGGATNGTSTLASGKSISVGGSGFSSGELRLARFTQTGSTTQSLTLSNTALLRVGPASSFDGDVNFIAPQLALDGATYNGVTYIEKSGATDNNSNGGNIFNNTTSLVNSGSGFFRFAVTTLDTFNGPVTLTNSGTSNIRMADVIAGTTFNDNITLNSTGGTGIGFGLGGGATTLASGKTIAIGASGFSAGTLTLARFTQTGPTAQVMALTGSSILTIGPVSTFNGDVTFSARRVLLNGATYNGVTYIEKNGAGDDSGNGGNTFNNTTTLVNSGSGYLLTANASPDIFNGDLTITNISSNIIYLAHNVGGTQFNGNIILNNTTGTGIYFCNNSNGNATLADTKTISVGATGFSGGQLRLRRFTQLGSAAQSLTVTNTAALIIGPTATFNGAVDFVAPQITLESSTFNSTASFHKNGASNNDCVGGNTFNGAATFRNSSAARLRLANTNADTFNGDVTFIKTSTGALEPAYAGSNTFTGNMTSNTNTTITLGAGTGSVNLSGGSNQSIAKVASTSSPIIQRLALNKSAGVATLDTDVTIGVSATFVTGILASSATNYINFADNAVVSGASNASYVDGPVRKTGNDIFTFPTGDGGVYRGIGISAPSVTTAAFTAEYFFAPHSYGTSKDITLFTVSTCEYWILDRTTGTSNVNVTLSWVKADCSGTYITDPTTLRVARFNGTRWQDHGNGSTTGDANSGTVTTSAVVTSFSPFTLGSTNGANPLPVSLLSFKGQEEKGTVQLQWSTATELNNDFFTLERSSNGLQFTTLGTVKGVGNAVSTQYYTYTDESPLKGLSYYRLKQTDIDGQTTYYNIISVYVPTTESTFVVYPNPVGQDKKIHFSDLYNISIYNGLNQLIMQAEGVSVVDVRHLAAGVYIIRNNKGETSKLVID